MEGLFTGACDGGVRDSGLGLEQDGFGLDIGGSSLLWRW